MCKFCDSLAEIKERENFYGYSDPELGRWMNEYTVALVIHGWYQKRGKKSASRTVDFRNKGLGYKLNFCPECGKKI
jgi:hypothetical protein